MRVNVVLINFFVRRLPAVERLSLATKSKNIGADSKKFIRTKKDIRAKCGISWVEQLSLVITQPFSYQQ